MASTQSATQEQNFDICTRNSANISCKTIYRKKPCFTEFRAFVYNFMSTQISYPCRKAANSGTPNPSNLLGPTALWARHLHCVPQTKNEI